MDMRFVAAGILLALVVVLYTLMVRAWRRRRSADDRSWILPSEPERLGETLVADEVDYVATSRADDPLERISAAGLGYRGPAEIAVHTTGLVLEVRGIAPLHVSASALRGAGRATFAIDRAVEPEGLVVIGWDWDGRAVDTYLKPRSPARGTALIEAVRPLVTERTEQPGDPNPESTY